MRRGKPCSSYASPPAPSISLIRIRCHARQRSGRVRPARDQPVARRRLAARNELRHPENPGSALSVIDLEHPRGAAAHRARCVAETTRGRVVCGEPHCVDDRRARRAAHRRSARGTRREPDRDRSAGLAHGLVAPVGMPAFVTNRGAGSTTVIDLASGRKLADVRTGDGSEAIAVTPSGNEVWVAARDAGTITVLDARTFEVLTTVPAPGHPIRIVMTPNGTALVSCAESSELVALDARGHREIGRVTLGVAVSSAANAVRRAVSCRSVSWLRAMQRHMLLRPGRTRSWCSPARPHGSAQDGRPG